MNYIGSKHSLLSFIDSAISDLVKEQNNIVFCDLFAGTSSVSKFFKIKGYTIISNDLQTYSYINAKHFIENNTELTFSGLKKKNIEPFSFLNSLKGSKGFIYNNYSLAGTSSDIHQRLYFTDENAMKVDAIRKEIEYWKNRKLITSNEYYFLISCLIESADKVANTASVYESYLKTIKKSASKPLILKPLETIKSDNKNHRVYNLDANNLIRKIEGDILYLDPPYNTRKYNTNYHLLETIAKYDNPKIKGKAGIRDEDNKKSLYSTKKYARDALEDLVKNAKFKYIVLSYNDEGIIAMEEIRNIMSKFGKYTYYKQEYKRFKADKDTNRTHKKTTVFEYLHCLEKENF
ncbi:DNA adenine methylase [Mycoplasma sp. 3341]|uniref:DNA adenine methylase n=1 Tax=Mycoplasma sp. 3341 TaxID=3447506 RepID=UPI003F656F7A